MTTFTSYAQNEIEKTIFYDFRTDSYGNKIDEEVTYK